MSTVTAWPHPWGVPRHQPVPPRVWLNADGSPVAVQCATAEALPADHAVVLELAARCLATALVRRYAGARQLADAFAGAGVRLPLLNWPVPALQPLELLVAVPR